MTETDVRSMDLRPRPEPNETNAFFWDAAAGHQLVLQRCDACSHFQYPPDVACVHCQCTETRPEEVQIGMPLEVCFEDRGEITLPQFRPRGDA
jgi:uncharacterized OB-fold protein